MIQQIQENPFTMLQQPTYAVTYITNKLSETNNKTKQSILTIPCNCAFTGSKAKTIIPKKSHSNDHSCC